MKKVLTLTHQATGSEISFCYGEKAYIKHLKKYYGQDMQMESDATTCVLEHNSLGFSIVIGVKEFKNIYELKALIVHELSHTVSELMTHYAFSCDEFRSYTLQWLYVEIIPFLDKLLGERDE